MALTVTNTFVDGATIEASEINQNFDDVEAKFAGGIVNADISASAAIATSKLAANKFSTIVVIPLITWDFSGGNNCQSAVPIPYVSGVASWTIKGIEYVGVVGGVTGTPQFRIASGTISDLNGTPTYHCAATNLPLTLTEARIASITSPTITPVLGSRTHLGIVRTTGGATADWTPTVNTFFTVAVTLEATLHT